MNIGPLNEGRLLSEILDRAESIALPDWRITGINLNPSGEGDGKPAELGSGSDERDRGEEMDNDRLELLLKIPGLLLPLTNEGIGLKGYRLCLFPGGCVLESPYMRNAAYVIRFDDRVPKTRRELRTMDEKEVDRMILALSGAELISAPKSVKRADGTGRVSRHVHQGDWEGRLRAAVAEIQ